MPHRKRRQVRLDQDKPLAVAQSVEVERMDIAIDKGRVVIDLVFRDFAEGLIRSRRVQVGVDDLDFLTAQPPAVPFEDKVLLLLVNQGLIPPGTVRDRPDPPRDR